MQRRRLSHTIIKSSKLILFIISTIHVPAYFVVNYLIYVFTKTQYFHVFHYISIENNDLPTLIDSLFV